jgi:hypothetical protein
MTLLLAHWPRSVTTTRLEGQATTGGSVSLTITLNVQLVMFPPLSVAVHATLLVPLAKVEPLGGVQFTMEPGQLSAAMAL